MSFASLGAGIGVTSVLIYSLGTSGDPHIELTLELASWIRTKRNDIETGDAASQWGNSIICVELRSSLK